MSELYVPAAAHRIPWARFPWFAVMLPSCAWTGVWLWGHRWRPVVLMWVVVVVALAFFALGSIALRREVTKL